MWIWIAQIVNFLILVALLRIFLYGPILKAIDQRQKKIASHFEAAEEKEQEAIRKSEELEGQRREFQEKRDAMLREARAEAEKRRGELSEKAREEVEAQARRWRDGLQRERESFLQEMEGRATEQVCAIARRALADLADAGLERQMVDVLLARLAELPDEGRSEMTQALARSGAPLVVATTWDLPEDDRAKISDAVHEHIAPETEVRFETAPELACGIELRAAGREISWTVAGYVQGLREHLGQLIDEKLEADRQRLEAEAAREKAAGEKAARDRKEAEERLAKKEEEAKAADEAEKGPEDGESEGKKAGGEKKASRKPREGDKPR